MSFFSTSPWPLIKLRDICGDKEQANPTLSPSDEFTYIDIGSVSNDKFRVTRPKRLIGRDAPSRARKRIRTGDVIVATTRPYLKSIAQISEEFDGDVCSTGFCVLRPTDLVTSDWLFFCSLTNDFIGQLTACMRGANYPAVTDRDVMDAEIPVPTVIEQHRIVAIIHDCMRNINEIESLSGQILDHTDHLPIAFRYDLWNDHINGNQLVTLDSISLSAKNGLYKHKDHHGSGTILIRGFNIKPAVMDMSRIEHIELTEKEMADYSIVNGDILVSRVNSKELVGKSALVANFQESAVHEAMVIRLRIDTNKADPHFLIWLMNSPQFLHDLRCRAKHAIGQSSINQHDLLSALIPLPTIDRQRDLIGCIRDFADLAMNLSIEIREKNIETSGLRDAILRKAFAGEL